MPAAATATPDKIKDANTRYHDAAAATYDAKWGIDYGSVGQGQVRAKLAKALGEPPNPFGEALEIGAGTGYFSLNLLQLGLIGRSTATDISPGMLETLAARAVALGLEAEAVVAEAERLPFGDRSFDLVFGHAVLHHIPDLRRAFGEFYRVLRPGGVIAFCGEPSRHGDRIAALPKRVGLLAAPIWRRAVGASAAGPSINGPGDDHELEFEVDVHAFAPDELRELLRAAGFGEARLQGEELLASAHGWLVRTLEATAEPAEVPNGWRNFAFRSYMTLQRVDADLLEPRLPPELFYNLVLSARRPG
ncbi:MAG: Methyltransferase type 11 [Solirubrobacterales bacterium]|jgi:ubiquinone/menaquinone biosynthesis C-methylase UbiE|nr:Methyltransferase type 11 [Solirubrobacterales bacterium]